MVSIVRLTDSIKVTCPGYIQRAVTKYSITYIIFYAMKDAMHPFKFTNVIKMPYTICR